MIRKIDKPGDLQLFLYDAGALPISQVAPFPKVTLSKITGTPEAIFTDETMTANGAGKWVLPWIPEKSGIYEATFEYEVASISRFYSEEIAVEDPTPSEAGELVGEIDED